jgi:DNA-directed RNA polymerase specialized sigma24 family protein
VILKHLDGFSYDDIGFIMDWPNAKVKSRLYAARQHLKEIVLAQQVNPRA